MIAGFLYTLSPRDQAGAILVPYYRTQVTAAAALGLTIVLPAIPADQALWLETLACDCLAGAAQTVGRVSFQYTVRGGSQTFNLLADTCNPGLLAYAFGRSCGILLSPGGNLQLDVQFSAGGAVNTAVFYATGWLIPRGNLGSV